MNAVDTMTRLARSRFAISTLSWTLHDVQDPQSPEPVDDDVANAGELVHDFGGAGTAALRFARFDHRGDAVLRGQKLREVVHEVMKVGLGVVDEADDFAGQAVERRRAAPRCVGKRGRRIVDERAVSHVLPLSVIT